MTLMAKTRTIRPSRATTAHASNSAAECPICRKEFERGTVGWHTHIAPLEKHPDWHPEITDGAVRKAVFIQEFPEFFSYAKTQARRAPPAERRAAHQPTAMRLAAAGVAAGAIPPPTYVPGAPMVSGVAAVGAAGACSTCPTCGAPVRLTFVPPEAKAHGT